METEQERDERLMQEALSYYDNMLGVHEACRVFGMSRYEYAHHFCISQYGGFRYAVTSSTTTVYAESMRERSQK